MSKKHTKTSTLGGSIIGGSLYTGNATNQFPTITTTSSTTSGYWVPYSQAPSHGPAYFDLYEQDGNLFWKNSKGEVFKLTFTKQETVQQIIDDL